MFWLVIGAVIILDQFTKYLAVKYLLMSETYSYPIIENVFHFTYVENRGAAFGILQNKQWFFIVLTIVSIILILFYVYRYKENINNITRLLLALIIGGAIGNFIDRVKNGYVVDFLDFNLINYPVFNIADCAVVVGTITLAAYILIKDWKKEQKDV